MDTPSQQFLSKEEVRTVVKDEMRHERRQAMARKLLLYAGAFTVFIALLLFVVGYTVAKLGVADVPVFTKWLYKPLVPTRVVYPLVGSTSQNVMAGVAARGVYSAASQTMSIYVNEPELSTILRDALAQSGTFHDVQAVVTPQHLEVYTMVDMNSKRVPVLLQLLPKVEEGELKVEVVQAVVGSLELPKMLLSAAVNTAVSQFSTSLKESLGGGVVTAVGLQEGKMTATFTVPQR